MIRFFVIVAISLGVTACSYGAPYSAYPEFVPRPGQGQYVRPAYLNAEPTARLPDVDACQSRIFTGLVGQHEGAIYIAGLPGRKRIIKPAELEAFGYGADDALFDQRPFVEVREFLPGQTLYAPAISNMQDRLNLGPEIPDRLTIELDEDGYVQQIDCR